MSLILRGIKGSALTHAELDNNLVWLKSRDIVDASFNGSNLILTKDDTSFYSVPIGGGSSGNMWFIPSGTTVTVPTNFQSFIYGDLYVEGTLDLQSNSQLVVLNGDLYLTGGTVTGTGTVYVVESDISVTGFTYNDKNQFSISQSDGTTLNTTINIVTGLTSTGDITVHGLTVGTGKGSVNSTAIGLYSLKNNVTGDGNTAIGFTSLYENISGSDNTAVGYNALSYNTGGTSNTTIGYRSMNHNIDGYDNTAVGKDALYNNTTGYDNTAVGMNTLFNTTSGYQNVAIGSGAGFACVDGTDNTFIGIGSGQNLVNGFGNTFIGENSGKGIIDGYYNTILGPNIVSLPSGLTNNVIISDGEGNRRINVDSSGNVGFGTSSFGASASNILSQINGIAPTTSPINQIQAYSDSGVWKYRDSSGNTITI